MYREQLMDHYKNPRNFGEIDASIVHEELNPNCGDRVTFFLDIHGKKIRKISFIGEGCAISLAASSMLAEELQGMSVDDALSISKDDVLAMIGIPLTTMRMKCGLLALHAVKKALLKGEEDVRS